MQSRSVLLWCCVALCLPLLAQTPPPASAHPIDKAEFRARRETLAKALAKARPDCTTVVLLRGGQKQADMGAFAQDQDFLYLTGVSEPDVAMLLVVAGDGTLQRDELLVPPYSPFSAKWDGRFLLPGEQSAEATGFATVGNVRSLAGALDELFAAQGDSKRILVTPERPAARLGSTPGKSAEAATTQQKDEFDGRPSRESALIAAMAARVADMEVVGLERFVHAMRPHKSPAEIALLQRSAEIAAEGIGQAMKSCAPGAFEYQLAAVARCVFALRGCGPDAYAAIVGGGANGCILHYNACDRQLSADDLIVMDYAATLHGYCSDVTRTFPASGTFSPEQKKLVNDVHEIQQLLIAEVKPGARLSALGAMCAKELVARGYKNDHGPCHHVGLAVHDPSVDVLAEGMVITVEPGAYLPDQGMGCRIEDTVLVTADGCRILSHGVPSSPDAIEAWMKQQPLIELGR